MASTSNPLAGAPAPRTETEAERAARRAHERVLLEGGFEDIRAGRYLTGAELDTWLDRFVQGLPPAPPDWNAG